MSHQYVFTMVRLTRVHPPDRTVLDDVTLAFLPGAKIGVLGPNGAGKSTLLRIMAGVDQDYRGEARLAPGASVGLLEQEPQLDESKDVRGNVEDGVRELRSLLDRFAELSASSSSRSKLQPQGVTGIPPPSPKNVVPSICVASPCRTVAASQPSTAARSSSSVSLLPGTSTVGVSITTSMSISCSRPR